MSLIPLKAFWIEMRFDIITIFPEMFGSFLFCGVIKKALEKGVIEVNVHNLRDFAENKHHQVDDRPFGGRPGMVLKPEPIFAAVEAVRRGSRTAVALLSPQGRRLDSVSTERFSTLEQMILICGRYEGVDERVVEHLVTDEISIGDYVLTGGEPAALVVIDAVSRFVPGVVGKEESVQTDSFAKDGFGAPQYTRPRNFRGMKVPEVLFSGDHGKIENWRRSMSKEKTLRVRPDLLEKQSLSSEDKQLLDGYQTAKEE